MIPFACLLGWSAKVIEGASDQPAEEEPNLAGSADVTHIELTLPQPSEFTDEEIDDAGLYSNEAKDSDQNPARKVIDIEKLRRVDLKSDKTGLIYMARIPVGMGPGKVKHLLSKWGAVNRIYLARQEEAKKLKVKRKGKEKHQSYQFKEGWIEFENKKVARRVAELLNTRPIGMLIATLE